MKEIPSLGAQRIQQQNHPSLAELSLAAALVLVYWRERHFAEWTKRGTGQLARWNVLVCEAQLHELGKCEGQRNRRHILDNGTASDSVSTEAL
jgi:hypothetical protein